MANLSTLRDTKGYYHLAENRVYPSVTTVGQIIFKPNLARWIQNRCIEKALEFPDKSISEIQKEVDKVKNNAGSVGRRSHHILEKAGPSKVILKDVDNDIKPYAKAFNAFRSSLKYEILDQELTVWSDIYQYAGTIDVVIKTFYGEVWIVDYKTSNYLHKSYDLQLAAYKQALLESRGIKADHCFLLQLKDNGTFKLQESKGDLNIFLAALSLWKWYYDYDKINHALKNISGEESPRNNKGTKGRLASSSFGIRETPKSKHSDKRDGLFGSG